MSESRRDGIFPIDDDSKIQRTSPCKDQPLPIIGAAIPVQSAQERGNLTRSEQRRAVSSSSTTCPSDNEKEVVIDSGIEVCEFAITKKILEIHFLSPKIV